MPDRDIVDTWERFVRYQRLAVTAMDQHLRVTFGRSLDDYDVLHQIGINDGPIRMSDLAGNLLVANSSCNRIVGRLVSDGLVERRQGVADGRVVLVELTPSGRSLRRRMAAVHTRDIQARFGALITQRQATDLDVILRQLLGETPTPQT